MSTNYGKSNFPEGLKSLIWKGIAGGLPIGRSWNVRLMKNCRCGSTMTFHHLWRSCRAYNLDLFEHLLNKEYDNALGNTYLNLHISNWKAWLQDDIELWHAALALKSLDSVPQLNKKEKQSLGKTRATREGIIGNYLWFIWKQRMTDTHEDNIFTPNVHVDSLLLALRTKSATRQT